MKKFLRYFLAVLLAGVLGWWIYDASPPNRAYTFGSEVDALNGVPVYYNGRVGHVEGRNVAPNGYNLGLKYQCVEFVKRYFFAHLGHQMPNSYGHAKDFFVAGIPDGAHNPDRNLTQFTHPSASRPGPDDLLVFGPSTFNSYGHVAIVADVRDGELEMVQQNPGRNGRSREVLGLEKVEGMWEVDRSDLLGWLRKK